MKNSAIYRIVLLLLCIQAIAVSAQHYRNVITHNDSLVFIHLDKINKKEYTHLMQYFHMEEDSLFIYGNVGWMMKQEGWYLIEKTKRTATIGKELNGTEKEFYNGHEPIYFDYSGNIGIKALGMPGTPGYPESVPYGLNKFKEKPSAFKNADGETVFVFREKMDANTVFISGNFNMWSTGGIPLQKTDTGWVVTLNLPPGKYLYKFIVNGKWQQDNNNLLRENDGFKSYNSTYFSYNHTFILPHFVNAKKVILTGSFNNWDEHELNMQKTPTAWVCSMYLREGTHAYKYIVDGHWELDPDNAVVRPDGLGNVNSYISKGKPHEFILNGFTNAKAVMLAGTFNAWNSAELQMEKTATGWRLPYVLGPGMYSYRFIVDGEWIVDPANKLFENTTGYQNSVLCIEPNYIFKLKDLSGAQQVLLSGSFNGWAEPGFEMMKTEDGWELPVYLAPGKYLYKYVVDGKWLIDPGNPLWENNEHNTGNSILWIEPKMEIVR